MVLDILGKDELNIVFSSIGSPKHILYLYSPEIDKYSICNSFFSGGKVAYVSSDSPSLIAKHVDSDKVSIIRPDEIDKIERYETVLIDATSIKLQPQKGEKSLVMEKVVGKKVARRRKRKEIGGVPETESDLLLKREAYLSKLSKGRLIVCAYELGSLSSKLLRELVSVHDKLVLSSSVDALPGGSSSVEDFDAKKIGEFIKNELEPIILALAMKRPICGREVKEVVYKKFNIFISSGTLYPLLHKLEKQGLLHAKVGIKTKTYSPADKGKIVRVLEEHIKVKNFLNGFLRTTVSGGEK